MTDLTCDVAVIGAGTAGRNAERSARRHGASTILIDESFSGTTCVRVGCMPSKLLLAAAEAAHAARRAGLFGIEIECLRIDGSAVMQRLQRERDAFLEADRKGVGELPDGVAVKGHARFIGPSSLQLDDGRRIAAKAIVIATGASPSVPDTFVRVADRVLTNETIFDLKTLPSSLAVVGAGPLGLELAQAFARLNVDVDVFDQGETIAGLEDREIECELRRIFEAEFPISTGVELTAERNGDGVRLSWTGSTKGEKSFERVLVSAGRPPNLKGLDLERSAIQLDGKGVPVFDRHTLQCGQVPVFIAGDADGDRPVLHEAQDEGSIAGRNAACFPEVKPAERSVPFSLMFTDPSVALIGTIATPGSADTVVGRASYADQGRAKIAARNAGTIRLYAARESGRLTGATLAGPGAEHSAHLIAWAIQEGRSASDLLRMPFYHPTFEEGLKPALREICEATRTDSR